MGNELKQIPMDATSFEANGITYHIKSSISIERFKWYEKYQLNFGFGRSFKNIIEALDKSVDLANKGKGLEAWNLIFNLRECVGKDLEKRYHNAFYLCALFMVTDDEDMTQWDETWAEQKIANWNKEYDPVSFFRIAANLVSGFLDDLEKISQDTSGVEKVLDQFKGSKQKS